ncbi:MAG: protein kinase [Candidatus Aminicenantes bacterium]|nr:protein kinase [Candidatus Aminicenantes bacterium]
MECPQCRADNPADTSFCGKCGSRLSIASNAPPSFTLTIPRGSLGIAKGRIIAGKYRVLEEVGRGGMGQVFKAEDARLHRTVAIKFLSPDLLGDPEHQSRFLREAQTASALNDPHICVIHEIGEDEGRPFIAMEFVAGRSLKETIQAQPMAAEEIGRYGLQIAGALQHAHDQGIIHRDLKTANVMITPDGRAKILDFGLAKRLAGGERREEQVSQKSITEAGTFLGTMSYMAPEVFRGDPADARSDIWSLGVMLYEMAAGKLPFDGQTGFELSSSILRDTPPSLPPQIPAPLGAIITRCLEKDPAQRYQRAGEIRADLQAFLSAAHLELFSSRSRSRRRWRTVAVTSAILIAVLVGLWIFRPSPGLSPVPGSGGATVSTGARASRLPEANEYFEKAMMFLAHQFDLSRAQKMLEKALDIDPAFAEARSWYAFSFILEIDSGYSNDSSLLYKAEEQLRRALQDDPNSARAHATFAALYFYQDQKELMSQEIEKALKTNPLEVDAKNWLGNLYNSNGETASAKAVFQELLDRDPLYFPARMNLGDILRTEGDHAGAIREFEKILEQDPQNSYAIPKIARVFIDRNDLRSARLRLEGLREKDAQGYESKITWAILLALEGKISEAQKKMDEECLKYAAVAPCATLMAAEYFAVTGDRIKAVDWLERAVRNGDERTEWFRRDRLLASIWDLPRFKQIQDSIAYRREQRSSAERKKSPEKRSAI